MPAPIANADPRLALAQPAVGYRSTSQAVRVATEAWLVATISCPVCNSESIEATTPGSPSKDAVCPRCSASFELKARSRPLSRLVLGGAYSPTIQALQQGRGPNLFLLRYQRDAGSKSNWGRVAALFVIPGFMLTPSIVIERHPSTVRNRSRAFRGCYLDLDELPSFGLIPIVVAGGVLRSRDDIHDDWGRRAFLASYSQRGWLLAGSTRQRMHRISRRWIVSATLRRIALSPPPRAVVRLREGHARRHVPDFGVRTRARERSYPSNSYVMSSTPSLNGLA